MKEQALEILSKYIEDEVSVYSALGELMALFEDNTTLSYSKNDVDFSYFAGVFNVSGIDGLSKEIERLKEIGKTPHDIILSARECSHSYKK